jgi:hypothetical protein
MTTTRVRLPTAVQTPLLHGSALPVLTPGQNQTRRSLHQVTSLPCHFLLSKTDPAHSSALVLKCMCHNSIQRLTYSAQCIFPSSS